MQTVKEFIETNQSYYRHLSYCEPEYPSYEPDDEDIIFLNKIFPTEIVPTLSSTQLAEHKLVSDFGTLIQFIEDASQYSQPTVDFTGIIFKSPAAWGGNDPHSNRHMAASYHRKKCQMIHRLLCRRFWKYADSEKFFGPPERRFIAFTPRDKKSSRSNTFKKDSELLNRFVELTKENRCSDYLTNLVLVREEMKLLKLQASWLIPKEQIQTLSILKSSLSDCLKRSLEYENKLRKELDAPKSEAKPNEKPEKLAPVPSVVPQLQRPDNDVAYFICSMVHKLHSYGFRIEEFQKRSIKNVHVRIRLMKLDKGSIKYERRVNVNDKNIMARVETNSRTALVKRISPSTYDDYLTKISIPQLNDLPQCYMPLAVRNACPNLMPKASHAVMNFASYETRKCAALVPYFNFSAKKKEEILEDNEIDFSADADLKYFEENFKSFLKRKSLQ